MFNSHAHKNGNLEKGKEKWLGHAYLLNLYITNSRYISLIFMLPDKQGKKKKKKLGDWENSSNGKLFTFINTSP